MTNDKSGGAAFPQEELEAVRRRHGSDHLHLRYDSREYRELYENAHTDRATLLAHVDRLYAELAKERERRVEVEEALSVLQYHAQQQLDYMDMCGDKGDLERNLRAALERAATLTKDTP